MTVISDSTARRKAAADCALHDLCFSEPLFRRRYEGWCVLGWGSYATVVRTYSRDAGREVALKIFFNVEPDLLERVREEVRASQRLTSQYVVGTYSMFDQGVIAWFEMELVEGPNLDTYMRRHTTQGRALDADECLDIALSVSRAVWYAHRRGVLHRDLKPSNVLLPDSGRPAAKVGDFGIAEVGDSTIMTPPGTIIGTPRFASPEALAGRRVGAAHDVYGLGLTLFSLFTGGGSPENIPRTAPLRVLRRLRSKEGRLRIAPLAAQLDPRVAPLIVQCLAVRPQQRPGNECVVTTLELIKRASVATSKSTGNDRFRAKPWLLALAVAGAAMIGLSARRTRKTKCRRDVVVTPDDAWGLPDLQAPPHSGPTP
jgi:serine/threonine protein kinase